MKSFYLIAAVLLLASTQAIADQQPAAKPSPVFVARKRVKHKMSKNPQLHCAAVRQACIAAGYLQTDPRPGKNLWSDCMTPMQHGRRVSRVKVSFADRQSCIAPKKKPKSPAAPVIPAKSPSATKSSQ